MCTSVFHDEVLKFLEVIPETEQVCKLYRLSSIEGLEKFKSALNEEFDVFCISGGLMHGISSSWAKDCIIRMRLKSDLSRLVFIQSKDLMALQRNPSLYKKIFSKQRISQFPCILVPFTDMGLIDPLKINSILESSTDGISKYLNDLYYKSKKQNRIVGEWFVFD